MVIGLGQPRLVLLPALVAAPLVEDEHGAWVGLGLGLGSGSGPGSGSGSGSGFDT